MIRGLTRNPSSAAAERLAGLSSNVSVVQADFSDRETLVKAFEGAEAVYAVTNYYDSKVQDDTLEEARQGCTIADIAKETGVKLVIWSTVPSALIRTGARFNSPRLVENKFTVSQYLKHHKVPHVDLYLGFYMDNWINFGQISKANDGAIEVAQPVMKPDTTIGMIWTERDLGRTVAAILTKYQTNPEIIAGPVYCVSGQWSTDDLVEEIRKQTGKAARFVPGPTSGLTDLDIMYHYYNEWGVYRDVQIPHPKTADLGLKYSTIAEYVREAVVPFIKTLE